MGLLQNGHWVDQWYDTKTTDGRFVRQGPQFRNWITSDGSPGPTGEEGFKAESGRYHLYISLACPWAHRTWLLYELRNLKSSLNLLIASPNHKGGLWEITPSWMGCKSLLEIYKFCEASDATQG